MPSAVGAPFKEAASVVFSWPTGLPPSTLVFLGKSCFLSLDCLKQPQRRRNGRWIIREDAGSLQSFLLPGILSRMCLLEPSEGGQLSRKDLFLLASLHPWEQSTSRSQNKILKVNVTIIVRVVVCSFMGWCGRDTVVGLCVLHHRYHAAFILDQTGLRFVPL